MLKDSGKVHRERMIKVHNERCQRSLRLTPTDFPALRVIIEGVTFAARLTEARNLRGITQAQLARLSGLTGAWVSKAESGKTTDVQARALFAVSRVLRVNPEWLAEGTGPRDAIPNHVAAEFVGLTESQQSAVSAVIQSMKK